MLNSRFRLLDSLDQDAPALLARLASNYREGETMLPADRAVGAYLQLRHGLLALCAGTCGTTVDDAQEALEALCLVWLLDDDRLVIL